MAKQPLAIVTDSTANLPQELVQKHNIRVIPQILNWEGESLLDGIDIFPDAFYRRLATAREIPTTSQPSPGQFLEFFNEVAETADSITGIFISEPLSGTLASAHAAVASMGDYPIEIVDSRSTSLALGLLVLAGARAAEAGRNYQEVAGIVRGLVSRLRIMFVVDTLEFLHKGGRIGGAQRLLGSMLSMKPVLHLQDGRIEPLARVRTKRKAMQHLLDVATAELAGKQNIHGAAIGAAAPEDMGYLVQQFRERVNPVEMVQNELTPVIGAHVGPGTVGLAYYAE
jgi:DegV family protein with EDD domain